MKLTEILKDSNYNLAQFKQEQIDRLEKGIEVKEVRGKQTPLTASLFQLLMKTNKIKSHH